MLAGTVRVLCAFLADFRQMAYIPFSRRTLPLRIIPKRFSGLLPSCFTFSTVCTEFIVFQNSKFKGAKFGFFPMRRVQIQNSEIPNLSSSQGEV